MALAGVAQAAACGGQRHEPCTWRTLSDAESECVTHFVTKADSGFLYPQPQIIPGHTAFLRVLSEFPG